MYIKTEYIKCDICGGDKCKILFKSRDYRFGRKETFNVVQCNECKLIYINPRPTAKAMLNLYKAYYTPIDKNYILPNLETQKVRIILKTIWHRYLGKYHDDLIKRIQGRILDIGCGNGNLLLPLKQRGRGVYGTEINPINAKYCNKIGLNVFCGMLEEANFDGEFFDTVILSQVIEHLPSPKKTLKEIYRILKPKGELYIFCPNYGSYLSRLFGKYWHGWHTPFHLYSFTIRTIKSLANDVNFKIKRIHTITPTHFFNVSLKSYLWGRCIGAKPIEKGRFLDSIFFKACITLFLRLLDFCFKGKGDCLEVELLKRE